MRTLLSGKCRRMAASKFCELISTSAGNASPRNDFPWLSFFEASALRRTNCPL